MSSPTATSTPIRVDLKHGLKPLALKESQSNVELKRFPQQPLRSKKNKGGRRSKSQTNETKENSGKPKVSPKKTPSKQKSNENEKKREELKRQQALDAMKLVEQRRLRIEQQLAAEVDDVEPLKPAIETRDEVAEKKRLEAKRLKEKRIKAHLAEQEARKNAAKDVVEVEMKPEKKFQIKPKPIDQRNIVAVSEHFRSRNRSAQQSMNPNPLLLFPGELLPIPFSRPLPMLRPFRSKLVKFNQVLPSLNEFDALVRIRYSKDEIRALNPYGYYFL